MAQRETTLLGSVVVEKLKKVADNVLIEVGGVIVGAWVSDDIEELMPHYYITVKWVSYYKSPVETQRPETKHEVEIYHGPSEDPDANYWFSL